jgi:hypothetical protein
MSRGYSIERVCNYLVGWLGYDTDLNNISIDEIKSALLNATSQLEDDQDGIEMISESPVFVEVEILK